MGLRAGMPVASEKVGGIRRFFDISVPRNIAPDITEAVNGRVFNVDDLKEVVSKNKEERRKAADEAQVLLDQEQLTFEAWRDSLETVPTIKVLHTDPLFTFSSSSCWCEHMLQNMTHHSELQPQQRIVLPVSCFRSTDAC